ncbi:hypothetical protein ABOM_001202 [Aspergillus bombycis]|uniref:Uncharacterized protein n=1 Tax=Aspergillus bombycis TaxID=109264 RepID=A0A1F8AG64_9EURO|nr:hypothetical protein ABOM_001202 [Aspergillus bombycis]OGM50335.1 hypothetical protein ABOM_001202 [Aspergillus bombycis]
MKSGIISTFIFAFLYASTASAVPPGTSNPNYSGGSTGGIGVSTGDTGAAGTAGASTGGRRVSSGGRRIEGGTSSNMRGKTRQQERYVEGACTTHGTYGTCQATDANGNDWAAPCSPNTPCATVGPRMCNIDTLRLIAVCS